MHTQLSGELEACVWPVFHICICFISLCFSVKKGFLFLPDRCSIFPINILLFYINDNNSLFDNCVLGKIMPF